jgi:NAD/NADP transhydrogenase beta subunit
MTANIAALLYLVAGVLFILALRGLSSPESSRMGNAFGIAGMTIAWPRIRRRGVALGSWWSPVLRLAAASAR